ncbi:hypothetical protein LTR96_011976, partial [Exophiala xenobiotica]
MKLVLSVRCAPRPNKKWVDWREDLALVRDENARLSMMNRKTNGAFRLRTEENM